MKFSAIDTAVCLAYCTIVITIGLIISNRISRRKDSTSYFFAGNTLPWYIVGSSIIAANISAEQFVGMSGSGYAMGLAIASYEWLASIMLLMVAIWFLPEFIISVQISILSKRLSVQKIFGKRNVVLYWLPGSNCLSPFL